MQHEPVSFQMDKFEQTLDQIKLFIEVGEPVWRQDNLLFLGHFEFSIQSFRGLTANAFSKHDVVSVDRRYSDFE